MSSTLFEMTLLRAISEFTDERDRMLYKENPQNRSETLELSPRLFKALVNLIKDVPVERSKQPNTSVGIGGTENEGAAKHLRDGNVLSEINHMLEKIYLDANWLKVMNNRSSVHLLQEDAVANQSSINENQPPRKEITPADVSDTGQRATITPWAQSGSIAKQGVAESTSESPAHQGESGPNYSAGQINTYSQNVSLTNETVKMINISHLYEHGQNFSHLLAKLNTVIAAVAKMFRVHKKEDLVKSETILLKIMNLSNIALQDLNGRLLVSVPQETGSDEPDNAELDKSLLIQKELTNELAKRKEINQINHVVQMFYKLEENLSNLKLFLDTYQNGKKRETADRLLDESLNLVGQLEQIPWLKGKNTFIDFELEALRDFAGVLSEVKVLHNEPSVEPVKTLTERDDIK